jgi:hypothetical protein
MLLEIPEEIGSFFVRTLVRVFESLDGISVYQLGLLGPEEVSPVEVVIVQF